jgi:hypothetical protein
LDIADLRRRGRTVTLDLRLRSNAPHGAPEHVIGADFASHADGDLSAVSLVDPVTGARLHPLTDEAAQDLFDEVLTPGGTKVLTVSFPAPRGKSADVIVPHFGSFRDVPVR